ncbi:MAG: riboflavin synthase [Gemmatimonadota bacterium]|nr:riboflavin synthase [Gemmatimonadota bacterium]
MFTGIVEATGTVEAVEPMGKGRRLTIAAPFADALDLGESVSIDGCCLTVVRNGEGSFDVEAVRETLKRTVAGDYEPGDRVNLERALAVGDRLGGHFVQGHVDAVGTVQSIERQGENRYIGLSFPAPDRPLVAPRGSIAVNGVSLTVLEVDDASVRLSIIPHTWDVTNFRSLAIDDRVNLEYDLIARYLRELLRTDPRKAQR